ncbi:phytase-like protein with esterase activity [Nitrosospira sp. Nsp5]|uniref:esterase-like activity of phytase family protein n=1 Tax=Nitrosospira TaxID=35798 RepID=UPI0009426325|nr:MULTISPECIES: esterase-like activity of phytase family protein [Nitrosospira]PTR09083.1 phytase-like protein with esterase activity [Nitrosospira sp. Nsp5]
MDFIRKTCAVVFAASLFAASITTPVYAVDFSVNSRLSYLGQQIIPTGTTFNGTTVDGLSSLDYNHGTGRYLAISDDRSNINPARFYELSLDLEKFRRSSAPGQDGVSFNTVTTIQKAGGGAFAANTVDPEGLRFDPARNRTYWSNEGQRSGAGFQNPTVREMNMDGSQVRDFAVPIAIILPALLPDLPQVTRAFTTTWASRIWLFQKTATPCIPPPRMV